MQFHGWAAMNRAALMPTREQAQHGGAGGGRGAGPAERAAGDRLRARRPSRAIPQGLHGRLGLDRDQRDARGAGAALPRGADHPGPELLVGARSRAPRRSGRDSPAFNAYRGTDWMQEPCRSCERKLVDFGGCRCQAMALAADPAATDPVCVKSPTTPRCWPRSRRRPPPSRRSSSIAPRPAEAAPKQPSPRCPGIDPDPEPALTIYLFYINML